MRTRLTLAIFSLIFAAFAATAGPIPYPNPGTQNPVTYTFTAAASGDILAYFDGSGASYTETLGLEVNGVPTGITGLNNHTTPVGTSLDLGHANAGDTLIFFINVLTTGNVWYSSQGLNADGSNHVYSTSFAGSALIPAGTYVGFEDLAASVSDFNYSDEQFVFSNTTASTASSPEPASLGITLLTLLGLELLGCLNVHQIERLTVVAEKLL